MRRLLFPCALGVALYFAVAGGEYSYLERREAEATLEARRAELARVRRQIDSLRARIDSLQHNNAALERFARERYGFIRDGEILYRMSEGELAPEAGEEARRSVWERLRGGGSGRSR